MPFFMFPPQSSSPFSTKNERFRFLPKLSNFHVSAVNLKIVQFRFNKYNRRLNQGLPFSQLRLSRLWPAKGRQKANAIFRDRTLGSIGFPFYFWIFWRPIGKLAQIP